MKDDDRQPVEVKKILQRMSSDELQDLSKFENHRYFVLLENFCKRYAQTKKGDILIELNPYDPQRMAIDVSFKRGQVYSLGVLIDIIKGAEKELQKRKED